jgi:hypothetical protein
MKSTTKDRAIRWVALLFNTTKPMTFDVILNNATAYNVSKMDIKRGEVFTVRLSGIENPEWYSNNDPVLDIREAVDGNSAIVTAKAIGDSVIQIQNDGRVIGKLYLSIFDTIANSLGITASEPELK